MADVQVAMPQPPDAGRGVVASPSVPSVADAATAPDGAAVPYRESTGLSGGSGEGTIGLGNIGTLGRRPPAGYGESWASRRRGTPRDPVVRRAAPTVQGGLSSEVVRRVVTRMQGQFRFCYEQGLVTHPDLEGRVVVRFVISPTGTVPTSAIAESTLSNPRVEQCLAGAVRRWMFPRPEGGGVVTVSYPFTFRPSSDE